MNCSRMQTLCPAKWDMLQARPPPPGHTPACTDTLWCLWIPDSTHSSGPHASLGCMSLGGTYTTLSTGDGVFLSVFRLFMLISAISFAWNKAKCLVGFTVHSRLSVSTCLLSLMRDGLWWAIMTKMHGRPPHCLIADSTVTGMKHIWVFYRLKRKYISTNFSHITIFCFISSVEYYDCSANLVFPTVLLILCIVFDLLAYYFPQSASWQQHWHREGSFKHSGEKEQQQPT